MAGVVAGAGTGTGDDGEAKWELGEVDVDAMGAKCVASVRTVVVAIRPSALCTVRGALWIGSGSRCVAGIAATGHPVSHYGAYSLSDSGDVGY